MMLIEQTEQAVFRDGGDPENPTIEVLCRDWQGPLPAEVFVLEQKLSDARGGSEFAMTFLKKFWGHLRNELNDTREPPLDVIAATEKMIRAMKDKAYDWSTGEGWGGFDPVAAGM